LRPEGTKCYKKKRTIEQPTTSATKKQRPEATKAITEATPN